MCLILFAWRYPPGTRLLLAANRDEFFRRPTRALHFWEDHPSILAGRDLEQGGSWLGVNTKRRFAAVTNFREPSRKSPGSVSRGLLVRDYLLSSADPHSYLQDVLQRRDDFDPFNLLVGDESAAGFLSSPEGEIRDLAPGIYGISNGLLDCPWPKVMHGKTRLAGLLAGDRTVQVESLFELLTDDRRFPDESLPDTGIGLEMERLVSPLFIHNGEYGTRSTAVLRISMRGEVNFVERSYDEHGKPTDTVSFDLC